MAARAWTPRFLQYCRVRGFTDNPRGMLEHDEQLYPGGKMAGYIGWLSLKWSDFYAQRPKGRPDLVTEDVHEEFDRWLEQQPTEGVIEGGA